MKSSRFIQLVALVATATQHAHAILPFATPNCLAFAPASNTVSLLAAGSSSPAPILIDSGDWPGVLRAAGDLGADFQRTTGATAPVMNITSSQALSESSAIIIGTLGKSSVVDAMVSAGKLDVSGIQGKWEAFIMKHVSAPLPGVGDALVVVGSDKRGSIYGLYTISEQLGVSPWHYWTDTASTQRTNGVHILSGSDCSAGSPSVQYRGIFINDEQPSLTNWANEKLRAAGSTAPTFRANFYELVFELVLRLKANYLWPAQWASSFGVDDPLNQFTADMFGIVMGTSHQEPMMRSTPNEWNTYGSGPYDFNVNSAALEAYWTVGTLRAKPFESLFSMGMRGNGDLPLGPTTNIALLQNIIAAQRQIISNAFNTSDQTSIPQMWCLYKEVQNYYNGGLRVPDDITLLWTDDNWGHVQRLPSASERARWGGAGIYFHFDYVGDPRDYKWINTINNAQTFQQLNLVAEYNATRIWIMNVGDLKGNEVPIDFSMSMAYNTSAFTKDNLMDYQTRWAEREFGSTELAPTIAAIVANFTKLNALRKPELVAPDTFSLINYREAENIEAQWETIAAAAADVFSKLPTAVQPTFFETVLHPANASANLNRLYIAAGRNNLHQGRASSSANAYADQVETMFNVDFQLKQQYHTILDGKWDHMMDQTHLGYFYWQQPMKDTMPPLSRMLTSSMALAGSMRIAVENSLGAWPGDDMNNCAAQFNCADPTLNALSPFGPTSRYFEISPSGPMSFTWNVTNFSPWVVVSQTSGTVGPNDLPTRVELSVDWSKFTGSGMQMGVVRVRSSAGDGVNVTLPAIQTSVPSNFHGFVEADGVVVMNAEHATRTTSAGGASFQTYPGFGTRTPGGVTAFPLIDQHFAAGQGPSMEFDFFTFNTPTGGNSTLVNVTSMIFSTFNLLQEGPCLFAIGLDNSELTTVTPIPPLPPNEFTPPDWDGTDGAAANAIRTPTVSFANVGPGMHTLKFFAINEGIIVEKFIVNMGGLLPSYLGPPESSMV